MSTITESELWAAIDAATEAVTTDRPDGSVTAVEYAAHYKIPFTTAHNRLRRSVAAGSMQVVVSLVPDARGHAVPTKCFVPVRGKKGK